MRLRRLILSRYGMFTDKELDFGSTVDQPYDFHIVYGRNEAGKSTALSGWLDFLYGIQRGSAYGYLHGQAMQVGAVIEGEDLLEDLVRIRGLKNSLRTNDSSAAPESRILQFLGDLDRTGYEMVFSVNDETLEKGGEEILASKGDLGELLFSASAGLADLSNRLEGLRQQCEEFYKYRARSRRLHSLVQEIQKLENSWEEIDTEASEFARLSEKLNLSNRLLDEARSKQARIRASINEASRKLTAMPIAEQLRDVRMQLRDHADLPAPPANWRSRVDDLADEHSKAKARKRELVRLVDALNDELAECIVDGDALGIAADVDRMASVKSAFDEATKDLPNRTAEARAVGEQIRHLLDRLELPERNPEDAIPKSAVLGKLKGLVEEHSGVQARLQAAEQEHREAKRRFTDLTNRLEEYGDLRGSTGHLETLSRRLRDNDPRQRLRSVTEELEEEERRLSHLMNELQPWRGTGQDLANLKAPDSKVLESLRKELSNAVSRAERERHHLKDIQEAVDKSAAALAGHSADDVVTTEAAVSAKKRRDDSWLFHRKSMTHETADSFENAMRYNDEMASRYSHYLVDRAVNREKRAKLAELRIRLEAQKQNMESSEKDIIRIGDCIRNCLEQVSESLSCELDVEAFQLWLQKRMSAIDVWLKSMARRSTRDSLIVEVEDLKEQFSVCLKELGVDDPGSSIGSMIANADDLIERRQQKSSTREMQIEARNELDRRSRNLGDASKEWEDWNSRWGVACRETEFAAKELPNVASMKEIIRVVENLDRKLAEQRALQDRIEKMALNRDSFERKVKEFAERLSINGLSTLDSWRLVSDRISLAREREHRAKELQSHREARLSELREIDLLNSRVSEQVDELGKPYGASLLPELREALTLADSAAGLRNEEQKLANMIKKALPGRTDLEQIESTLLEDRALLEQEQIQLEDKLEESTGDLEEALAQVREAKRKLAKVSGGDQVAKIKSDHANLLLQLRDEAEQHLRRKMGILAVEHAIRKYRDTHRSEMMDKASSAFSKISCGSYDRLGTAVRKNREVLVASVRDGATKFVEQLSKGTRFQLYLALRIAGFYEIKKSRSPVPFIADDILETFDNERATEALKVLREMSRGGQVIYLTHHEHLCDIARDACPDALIQEL